MNADAQDSALFAAILDAAVDAVIVADDTGAVIRANPAACDLFLYEPGELIGKSINILMPEALGKLHDGFISQHIRTGENRIIGRGREVEGLRKDKSVFPLHLSVGKAEFGGTRMFIGILHDLTLRKATLEALARSQRLDAIGQMTGGIAHDFNNLLTVVIGNLELLEMRNTDDRHSSLINDALESAQMGADLTERLMVFARRGNLHPIKGDLKELCEQTLSLLKRTLGATYSVKADFEPGAHQVLIDPVQLQSALINLALNARDAMVPSGELLVTISNVTIDDTYIAQETDIQPGDYVRLSVSDNGAGMSSEAQKRAFEPFFTEKADSGGTGLGLAMVYGFVRQSGGHITLYSELGHGTSFGLYFPAIIGSDSDSDSFKQTIGSPLVELGQGKIIMVVEDNPQVRKLSVKRIRDLGFIVKEASSGDDAYQMLLEGEYADVLFSDLVMPGSLNGYDLAAKVEQEFPHLKVLLTSGYISDLITGAMAHDRHYDILHKPFRQSELIHRLQALLAEDSET